MKRLLVLLISVLSAHAHAQAVEECSLWAPSHLQIPALAIGETSARVHYYVEVECEAGLAFQVELSNAFPGGVLEVSGPARNPLQLFVRHAETRLPWGAAANGEALVGVGTGKRVSYPIELSVSLDLLPEPGEYRVIPEINLTF